MNGTKSLHLAIVCAALILSAASPARAQSQASPTRGSGKDPASLIANGVTNVVPEASGMFALGEEFAARLKRLDARELLPMNITPSNFLDEAHKIVKSSSARELAGMSVQAGRLALQIEDVKLGYLQAKLCTGLTTATAQYSAEVEAGCKLIELQQRLSRLQLKGLDLVEEQTGSE